MNFKHIAKDILENFANCYSEVDLENLTEVLEDISIETAKDILTYVGNIKDDDERFSLKDYEWHRKLRKKYKIN